jgi:hypothetical protein
MTDVNAHYAFAVTAQTAAATVDGGPGSGWVPFDAEFVQVTSSSSAKFVILSNLIPVGREFKMAVGANGYKLGTPAGSTLTINNVDTSGGTASAVIPANTTAMIVRTLSTGFILSNYTNLGAVATAIVPS